MGVMKSQKNLSNNFGRPIQKLKDLLLLITILKVFPRKILQTVKKYMLLRMERIWDFQKLLIKVFDMHLLKRQNIYCLSIMTPSQQKDWLNHCKIFYKKIRALEL